jgi:hypothetical protein
MNGNFVLSQKQKLPMHHVLIWTIIIAATIAAVWWFMV